MEKISKKEVTKKNKIKRSEQKIGDKELIIKDKKEVKKKKMVKSVDKKIGNKKYDKN